MSILLFLLAFPGLTVIAAALWLRASRRYQELMKQVASYPDPSIDDVIDQGIIRTYRRTSLVAAEMDEGARSGSLGSEAQRLQAFERRWFFLVGLSIPVGMGLAFVASWMLSSVATVAETSTDTVAVAILLLTCFTLIGVASGKSAMAMARSPRTRPTAGLYFVGLAVLGIAAAIFLSRFLG